jgi:hypothetical protein
MHGRHLAARAGLSRKEVGSSALTLEISLKSNMEPIARVSVAGNLGTMLSKAMEN